MRTNPKIDKISSINFSQNQITKIAQNKEFVELITALYWFDIPNIINLLNGSTPLEECCSKGDWLYRALNNKPTLFEEKKTWRSGSDLYLKSNLRKDLKLVFPFIDDKTSIDIKVVQILLSQLLSSKLDIKVTPENLYKVCNKYKLELLNFSNIDLSHTNLSGLDMSEINFQGTIFDYSNLKGTNFTGSNLSLATFIKADLTYTNFTGANLSHTNLSQAIIYLTIFCEANFRWVKFTLPNQNQTPKTIWRGGDLRKSVCTGTDFRNVTFKNYQEISLSGDARYSFSHKNYIQLTKFLTEANLMYANFSNKDLSNFDFSWSNLSYANLNNTNLEYTVLTNTELKGIQINGANLINATQINLIIINAYLLHWLILKHTPLHNVDDIFKEIFKSIIQLAVYISQPNVMQSFL